MALGMPSPSRIIRYLSLSIDSVLVAAGEIVLRLGQGRDRVVGNQGQPGAGIAADPGGLAAVQLGIDRDRHRAGPPDAVEAFEILRELGCEQSDAVAGRNAVVTDSAAPMAAARRAKVA